MPRPYIPSPRNMHERATFGVLEQDISSLPMYEVVCTYLQGNNGDGFDNAKISGIYTREVMTIPIPDMTCYEQLMTIAQYLWDTGYFVGFRFPKVPGGAVEPVDTMPSMVICWDPAIIRRKQFACPCWVCAELFKQKMECAGCVKYFNWRGSKPAL